MARKKVGRAVKVSKMEEQEQQEADGKLMPNLLYHYTDQNGLSGILENGCIWATHHRFLNDISERQEAIRYFSNVISRQKSNKSPTGRGGQIKEFFQGEVQRNFEKESQSVDAYFVCFTQEDEDPELTSDSQMLGDRLSQWRGYAKGRQGFSLAFRRDRLMSDADQLPKTKMLINLLKCIYSDPVKEGASSVFLGNHDIGVFSWGRNGPEDDINQLSQLKRLFHQFFSGFKHIGFEEEKEWRLAFHMLVEYPDIQLIQFRDGRTPYIKVPLRLKCQDSPLKRIVVGPSQNKDQIVVSLRLELAQMGIQGVQVVPSKIPYRNW